MARLTVKQWQRKIRNTTNMVCNRNHERITIPHDGLMQKTENTLKLLLNFT